MKNIWFCFAILIFTGIITIVSCSSEDDRLHHRVLTSKINSINSSGVSVTGEIKLADDIDIIDHGFVYIEKRSYSPSLETQNENLFEKLTLGDTKGNGNFDGLLEVNLQKGIPYIVKAYAQSRDFMVYGDTLQFVSLGGSNPVIQRIEPDTASFGDIIQIVGENFSVQPLSNDVLFGEVSANVESASDTLLNVKVPGEIEISHMPVLIRQGKIESSEEVFFTVAPPLIDSVRPAKVLANDKVTIYGKNLGIVRAVQIAGDNVYGGGMYGLDAWTNTHLSVKLSNTIFKGDAPIALLYLDNKAEYEGKMEIVHPVITDVYPQKVFLDTVLTLKGTYLDKLDYSLLGSVVSKTDTIVKLKIYSDLDDGPLEPYYLNYQNKISSETNIEWLPPVIHSIGDMVKQAGEEVVLDGERFIKPGRYTSLMRIEVDETQEIVYGEYDNEHRYRFKMPVLSPGTYHFNLNYNINGLVPFPQEIIVPEINILSVSPETLYRERNFQIELENCDLDNEASVYVNDDVYCGIIERKDNYLKAKIPIYADLEQIEKITVKAKGQTAEYYDAFKYLEPWDKINESVITKPTGHWASYKNSIIAIGFNNIGGKRIYQYYTGGEWETLSDFNPIGYSIESAFVHRDDFFILTRNGLDLEIWRYSLKDRIWKDSYMVTLDEGFYSDPYSMVIDDRIFIGGKEYLFELNAETGEFKYVSKIPTYYSYVDYPLFFSAGGKGYLGFYGDSRINNQLWEYDPNIDEWQLIGKMPFSIFSNDAVTAAAVNGNRVYIQNRPHNYDNEINSMFEFDIVDRTWKKMIPIPMPYEGILMTFFSDGVLYGGSINRWNATVKTYQFNFQKMDEINNIQ